MVDGGVRPGEEQCFVAGVGPADAVRRCTVRPAYLQNLAVAHRLVHVGTTDDDPVADLCAHAAASSLGLGPCHQLHGAAEPTHAPGTFVRASTPDGPGTATDGSLAGTASRPGAAVWRRGKESA